jgi:hypothetical protein
MKLALETNQERNTTLEEDLIAPDIVVNKDIIIHKDINTIQENDREIDTNLEGDLGAPVNIEK